MFIEKMMQMIKKLNIGDDTCNMENCEFLKENLRIVEDLLRKNDGSSSKIRELETTVAEQQDTINEITAKYDESQSKFEAAQGIIAKLTYDLYGRSSEQI